MATPSISELLLRWQELRDQGQEVTPEHLCAGRPELIAELRRQIQALASMDDLLKPDQAINHAPATLDFPRARADQAHGYGDGAVKLSEQGRQHDGRREAERLAVVGGNAAVPENHAGLQTGLFERLASFCEDFREKWGAGERPSIQAYLDRIHPDAQPVLFSNLLVTEVENRRAAGDPPHLDEYLERFPHFSDVIRTIFLEFSSAYSVSTRLSVKPKLGPLRVPSVSRLGDYRLLGELGRGGMGVVYEAYHIQRGDHVGLKTLPTVDGAALHRFKREFRALAGVNHPNLIGLQSLEVDGGQWFFTMELIEGVTFLKYVRPDGRLDESRLRSALSQLVAGVMALHGNHILHRDLKPSNVMVTHDGRVVVLDFGLVLELDWAGHVSQSTNKVAGTPAYMAPEQAAGHPSRRRATGTP